MSKFFNQPSGRASAWIVAIFFLPLAAAFCIVFRNCSMPAFDVGFLYLATAFYVILGASLLVPRLHELVLFFLVFLILAFHRRKTGRLSGPARRALFVRLAFGYLCLRLALLSELASGLLLYRNAQAAAALFLALSIGVFTGVRRRWRPAMLAAAGAVYFAVALAFALRQYPLQPFEVAGGVVLGILGWLLFHRPERFAAGGFRLAKAALIWLIAILSLGIPDLLVTYLAFHSGLPRAQWADRSEGSCYDAIASRDGSNVFSTGGPVRRYRIQGRIAFKDAQSKYISAQRLALDAEGGMLYVPAYDSSSAKTTDVIGFDLNLKPIDGIKWPACKMPLYIQFSPRWKKLYYACEESGQIIEYEPSNRGLRLLETVSTPNHLQLGELENNLLVFPVLRGRVPVVALPEGKPVRQISAVPPIYGSAEDRSRNLWALARFMLGDLELRDGRTFRPVGNIRLDLGPRDLEIDRAGGRLFTCSYFVGTLCIIDLDRQTVGRLYAGVRARGLYYDAGLKRLYFCSPLGLGYYEEEALNSAYQSRGFLSNAREVIHIFLNPNESLRIPEVLSLFMLLLKPETELP